MADVKYIPNLRFPEFENDGEWKEVKLGEIIYVINPPKKLHSCDYRQKGLYPIIDQSQNYICGYTDGKEGLLNEDKDFLIVFGDHTCVLKSVDFPFVQGADGIKIFRSKMIDCVDTKYIYQFLLSKPIAANEYKRHFSELKEIDIVFPHSIKEQQKIAAFLTSLDEQISAHTKKLEALKAHKKGLMQQLFPANGEKTPKLRFPEFKNAGEWKEVRLGDVTKERNEINKTELALLSIGQDGVYPQSESTKRDVSNKDKTKYKHICPNDIGYNTMRMWQGRSAISYLEGIVSPAYTIVIPQANIVPLFLAIVLKLPETVNEFFKHSQGLVSDTLNCKYKDFVQVQICIPSLPEQQKIATFLTSIDEMIQAQDDKIQKLKTYKNGLMQQMFPSVETPYYDVSTVID